MGDNPSERIPFLEGWYFRPQKDVLGFYELCRPDGTVASIVAADVAQRLAASFATRVPNK